MFPIRFTSFLPFCAFGQMIGVPFSDEVLDVSEAFEDADIAGSEGDTGRSDICSSNTAD